MRGTRRFAMIRRSSMQVARALSGATLSRTDWPKRRSFSVVGFDAAMLSLRKLSGQTPRERSLAGSAGRRPAGEQGAQRGDEGDRLVEHEVVAGFGDLDARGTRRRLRSLPGDHALVDELRFTAPDDRHRAASGLEPDRRIAVAVLRPDRGIEAPGHPGLGLAG